MHDAFADFVQMLDDNIVDIDQAPIRDYDYNEMDGGVHGHVRKKITWRRLRRGCSMKC